MLNSLSNWRCLSVLWLDIRISAACLCCASSLCRVPVGAGQPRNSGAGGVPTTKGAPGTIHPIGTGHTNTATAVRPVVPITAPQAHPQLQAASPQLNNCLRYSAQQPASQTRNAMQMGMCTPTGVSCPVSAGLMLCSSGTSLSDLPSPTTFFLTLVTAQSMQDGVCFICL